MFCLFFEVIVDSELCPLVVILLNICTKLEDHDGIFNIHSREEQGLFLGLKGAKRCLLASGYITGKNLSQLRHFLPGRLLQVVEVEAH